MVEQISILQLMEQEDIPERTELVEMTQGRAGTKCEEEGAEEGSCSCAAWAGKTQK